MSYGEGIIKIAIFSSFFLYCGAQRLFLETVTLLIERNHMVDYTTIYKNSTALKEGGPMRVLYMTKPNFYPAIKSRNSREWVKAYRA